MPHSAEESRIMPKPEPKEIDAADLLDYLATESDFAFETRVVKEFRKREFDVQHGGTYMDSVKGIPRQFDVRATLEDDYRVIRLAVESKNLKKTFPMLVSCLPRSQEEAFQCVTFSINLDAVTFSDVERGHFHSKVDEPYVKTLHVTGANSVYKITDPVGKSVAQVARDSATSQFTANDSEIYGKWSQALSSSDDLVSMSAGDGARSPIYARFSATVPVLVVPDGMLWTCVYDDDGNRIVDPVQSRRIPIFVGKECDYGRQLFGYQPFIISHLEVVTFSGIADLIAAFTEHRAIVTDELAKSLVKDLGPGFDDIDDSTLS
jgi:hypothetical protein